MEPLNTDKFGLVPQAKSKSGMTRSYQVVSQGATLDVVILENCRVTISLTNFGASTPNTVAKDYRCDTQEQFDFLMYNGPAGRLFNQVMKQP